MSSNFNKKIIKLLIFNTLMLLIFNGFAQNSKQNLSEALQILNQKRGISFAIDQQKLGNKQVNKITEFSGNIEQILSKILKNTGQNPSRFLRISKVAMVYFLGIISLELW